MIEKYNEVSYLSLPTGLAAAAEGRPETKKDLKEWHSQTTNCHLQLLIKNGDHLGHFHCYFEFWQHCSKTKAKQCMWWGIT